MRDSMEEAFASLAPLAMARHVCVHIRKHCGLERDLGGEVMAWQCDGKVDEDGEVR